MLNLELDTCRRSAARQELIKKSGTGTTFHVLRHAQSTDTSPFAPTPQEKKLAVVRINGRDLYLGKFGSPESWEKKCHRVIAAFLGGVSDPSPVASPSTQSSLRVKELALRYFEFAETYYKKCGHETSEIACLRATIRRLLKLFPDFPVNEFGPSKLKLVREEFVREGLTRSVVNKNVSRIRRVFRWGVEQEIVPVTVFPSLQAVAGLKKGRSQAKEKGPILPFTAAVINATLPHLASTLQALSSTSSLTRNESAPRHEAMRPTRKRPS